MIISISLPEKLEEELRKVQKKEGYGKSELVRAALRAFVEKEIEPEKLVEGALIVTLPEHKRDTLHNIQHRFENIIKTQLHHCLMDEKCMNIFLVKGKGKDIEKCVHELRQIPKVEKVSIVLA